jgi:hypothetical protein
MTRKFPGFEIDIDMALNPDLGSLAQKLFRTGSIRDCRFGKTKTLVNWLLVSPKLGRKANGGPEIRLIQEAAAN